MSPGSEEQDEIVRKATKEASDYTEREEHRGQRADNLTRSGGSIMGSEEFRKKHVQKRSTKPDGPWAM